MKPPKQELGLLEAKIHSLDDLVAVKGHDVKWHDLSS